MPGADREFNDLRHALAEARVVRSRAENPGTRSGAGICYATLQGGVEAFWKRGDVDPPGIHGVRREIAAYEIACHLGWDDLLPVVAHRYERTEQGVAVEIASIELLVQGEDDFSAERFTIDEIQRAGVFDALIANSDREGHNWRAIPDGAGGYRLKLYDHESAFVCTPDLVVSSSFWSAIKGIVPDKIRDRLRQRRDALTNSDSVARLLTADERNAYLARLDRLVA